MKLVASRKLYAYNYRVVLLARNIVEHVGGERNELLPDEHPQSPDRCVAQMFVPVDRLFVIFWNAEV